MDEHGCEYIDNEWWFPFRHRGTPKLIIHIFDGTGFHETKTIQLWWGHPHDELETSKWPFRSIDPHSAPSACKYSATAWRRPRGELNDQISSNPRSCQKKQMVNISLHPKWTAMPANCVVTHIFDDGGLLWLVRYHQGYQGYQGYCEFFGISSVCSQCRANDHPTKKSQLGSRFRMTGDLFKIP